METIKYLDNKLLLPSRGEAYDPEKLTLIQGNSLVVRKWTAGHDRLITNMLKSGDIYKIFTWLMQQVVIDPDPLRMNLDEFLISDVMEIMFMCKVWTWGPVQEFPYACPSCRFDNIEDVDIGQLLSKSPEDFIETAYKASGLEFTTSDNVKLVMHLPRLADEREVSKVMRDRKRRHMIEDERTDADYVRIAQLIDTVDGKAMTPEQKFNQLMNFDMIDIEDIQEFIGTSDTGIQLDQIETGCGRCGKEVTVNLGMSPDFFRPPSRRRNSVSKEGKNGGISKHQSVRHSPDDAATVGGTVE